MLAVQRKIQESQIRNTDNIARLESYIQENAELIKVEQDVRDIKRQLRGNS